MVDNIDVTPGSGKTIAADDVGGALHQRVKLALGANGTAVDAGAGAGAVGTDTQRVTLGSDDPAVVSLQLIDDTIATLGTTTYSEATTKGAIVGAVRRDANTSLVDTTNEVAPLQVNATGELKVAQIQALPAGTAVIGKVSIDQTTPGTTNLVAANGDVAHDAADSGNPVKVGAKAAAGLSGATLVSAGDRINAIGGLDGVIYVRTHCGLEDIVSGTASNTDGTSTEVIAAAAAGVKQYLTHVSLSNVHASTNVMVALKSGATSKYRVAVPPGGREIYFDPPLPPNAAAEAWNFDPDSAVTTLECSMVGFKSKV